MKSFLFLVFLFLGCGFQAKAKKQTLDFNRSSYPVSKFVVVCDTFSFGKIDLIKILVSPKSQSGQGFSCRSWLLVNNKQHKKLQSIYFDIEALGGCSGIYVPSKQPLKSFFILSKFGDYDGRTLIVDTNGKIFSVKGGAFVISPDKKFVFTDWDSDVSGISVFDIQNKKVVLNKEMQDEDRIKSFYSIKGKFYVSFEENGFYGYIDVKSNRFMKAKISNDLFKNVKPLNKYNEVLNLNKCNCGL